MEKEEGQEQTSALVDTFIREVRVNYVTNQTKQFKISGPLDIAEFVRSVLTDNSREHFVAIYLDGFHRVASYSIVSIGIANETQAHPREIFQRAVLVGAVSIVIAHNHPSNETTPSKQDRSLTKRIREAATLLGIRFLDHVIVTDFSFYSFKESDRNWESDSKIW